MRRRVGRRRRRCLRGRFPAAARPQPGRRRRAAQRAGRRAGPDARPEQRGQPSVVIPVKMDNDYPVDGGPLYNGNGEVAYLQYKKFDIPHRAKTEDLL